MNKKENPSFLVKPVNSLIGLEKSFDTVNPQIINGIYELSATCTSLKMIELIQLSKSFDSTEEALKEIDEQGFELVSAEYVVGFGVGYPKEHKKYKYIFSPRPEDKFTNSKREYPCHFCLVLKRSNRRSLDITHDDPKEPGISNIWWIMVVRKES